MGITHDQRSGIRVMAKMSPAPPSTVYPYMVVWPYRMAIQYTHIWSYDAIGTCQLCTHPTPLCPMGSRGSPGIFDGILPYIGMLYGHITIYRHAPYPNIWPAVAHRLLKQGHYLCEVVPSRWAQGHSESGVRWVSEWCQISVR